VVVAVVMAWGDRREGPARAVVTPAIDNSDDDGVMRESRATSPVEPTGRFPSDAARHPADVLRAGLGALALVGTGIAARRKGLGRAEADAFRLVNDLPAALEKPLVVVMQAGSLAAVPAAAAVALAARRPRLARDLVTAGASAYVLAKVAKAVVGRGRPGSLLSHVLFRGATETGLGFPSGHVAVAAALATAAGPHLGRTGRRVTWAVVAVVAVARMYVGAHLPVDVVGGAALGWLVGAAVHLLWGAPGGQPRAPAVQAALEGAGLRPFEVTRAGVDARGSTPFFATAGDGRNLFVKAVGREQRDADVLFKTWRFLSYRHVEDETPFATPKQQVEHEAFVSLLAERAGVRTPRVVTTAETGDGTTLLVQERVTGRSLDDEADVPDATLADVWRQVSGLRSARIAHRDLRLANVVADGDGRAWLIDFGFAEASASDRALAGDVAGLLASSAMLVGPERAVATAIEVLGTQAVGDAMPLLQPLALSAATRGALRHRPDLLQEVRRQAAAAAGIEAPELEPLTRVRPRTLLLVLGGGFAVHLLLPRVGEFGRTLEAVRGASWGWLVAGLVASTGTYLAAGIAQLGVVSQPLALGRTVAVQVASSFTNRLTPGSVGGLGVNLRYLERSGLSRPEAVAAVGLKGAAGLVVHLLALAVTLPLVGRAGIGEVKTPEGWEVLVVLVVVSAVAGVALWSPLGRRRLMTPARAAARSLAATLRVPVKALQVFGGSSGVTACYIFAFAASLRAFGADASAVNVAAVYLGGSAIGSVAPTPGGLGAVEAALVAGLTAVGVASGPAVTGVLAYRLLTYWLPIIPGWLIFRALRHRHVI
jgi:glycosyltransferase 2 family protein